MLHVASGASEAFEAAPCLSPFETLPALRNPMLQDGSIMVDL